MTTAAALVPQKITADHATAAERALSRAFVAAWLIAGCPLRAGQAVEQGIARWHPAKPCERGLIRQVIQAALELPGDADRAITENSADAPELAPELARVLQLPPSLRNPFVLRMLARLPLPVCTELLRLSVPEFQNRLACAISELPFFAA